MFKKTVVLFFALLAYNSISSAQQTIQTFSYDSGLRFSSGHDIITRGNYGGYNCDVYRYPDYCWIYINKNESTPGWSMSSPGGHVYVEKRKPELAMFAVLKSDLFKFFNSVYVEYYENNKDIEARVRCGAQPRWNTSQSVVGSVCRIQSIKGFAKVQPPKTPVKCPKGILCGKKLPKTTAVKPATVAAPLIR